MTTVKLISENEAQGELKDLYAKIKQMSGGEIPIPFQAMANHPEYLKMVLGKLQTVMGSDAIDQKSKLMIALTISILNNCEFCITMYTKQLKDAGFTDKQFVEILAMIDLVGAMNHFNNGMKIKPE